MDTSGMTRAAGAWWQLLLVVLALGVFAMHTTGHPDGGSGMSHPGPAPYSYSAPEAVHGPAERQDSAHLPQPGMAMDMSSLCVAVLVGWILAALLRAAPGRGADRRAAAPAGVFAAPGPGPPPPRPDLAKLSILRI
ncbi:DUF6153 family protein [Streptomyces inusitatus]|uniref:DUF6153 family protein n=1 Tax=Streptomyces inusitatus TaxID=68221 RepID=UPI001E61EFD5|nr:DUF6153 family protein [Streptomyces inusitatus]